jgi:PIN domain nuclease of toxin-antitoxin system
LTQLLLDSHALLWWLGDDPRLGSQARSAIEQTTEGLYFSAASIWELAIKQSLGKLKLPGSLLEKLAEEGFTELRISAAHGLAASALPQHHRDPFDRMLVAQAQSERLTVMTRDERIALYDISVLW